MSEAISRACEAAKKAAAEVYVCCDITRYKEKKGEESRILVITEMFIAIYQYAKVAQESLYYWTDLISYEFDNTAIEMRFNLKKDSFLKFSCLELACCHFKILRILESGFAPSELSPLQLDRFEHKKKQTGGLPLYGRYVAALNRTKKPVANASVENALKELAISRRSSFDLSGLEKWEAVSGPLYSTLAVMPFLESLVLKASEKKGDFWSDLAKHISNFVFLKHLQIKEKPDKRFKDFVEGAKTTHLSGLSFMCELKKDNVSQIRAIAECTSMKSFGFENAFGKGCTMDLLCSELLVPCSTSLRVLNFSKMQVNMLDIVTNLPQLSVLGLRNCGLRIDHALLALSKLENLRMLDLSENEGTFQNREAIAPPRLMRLDATDVKWDEKSLKNFMTFICRRHWAMGIELYIQRLSVSDTDMLDRVWKIFDAIQGPIPITAFSWDGTLPAESLITFLCKCPNLHTLSLQSTFGAEDGEIIEKFAEDLPSMTQLRSLVLSGIELQCGCEIVNVIQSLASVTSLTYLDLSYQSLGESGMLALAELIKGSPGIQTLIYDECCGDSVQALKELVKAAASRQSTWEFMYPLQTMNLFSEKGILSPEDAKELKRDIAAIQGNEVPDDEEPSEFLVTSSTSLDFPRYLTRQTEQVLMIPMEVSDELPPPLMDEPAPTDEVVEVEPIVTCQIDTPKHEAPTSFLSSSEDEKLGSKMLMSDDDTFRKRGRNKNLFLSDSSDEESVDKNEKPTTPEPVVEKTPPARPKALEITQKKFESSDDEPLASPKVEPTVPHRRIIQTDEPVMFSLDDASAKEEANFLESSSSDDKRRKRKSKGFLDSESEDKPQDKTASNSEDEPGDSLKDKLKKLDDGKRLPGVKRKSIFLESSDDDEDFQFEDAHKPSPKPKKISADIPLFKPHVDLAESDRPASGRVSPRRTLDNRAHLADLSDSTAKPSRRRVSAQDQAQPKEEEKTSRPRRHRNAQGEYSTDSEGRSKPPIPRSPSSSLSDKSSTSSEDVEHSRRHRHRIEGDSQVSKRKSCIPTYERSKPDGDGSGGLSPRSTRASQIESDGVQRRHRRAHEEPTKNAPMSSIRANARRTRTSPMNSSLSPGDLHGSVEYQPPSWDDFPIPRVAKARDNRILKELTKEFAISDAINSLKTDQ